MQTTKLITLLAGSCLWAVSAMAAPQDYAEYFKVDLDQPLPKYEELQQKYLVDNRNYNRRYDYHWDIGNIFDQVFRQTIDEYGSREKRLKHMHEDDLLEMLSMLPTEYYQYIGPYLHTVPNMPEKVLNMPGIKETKNKFPTRIAPQLQGIEDLEFLSPYLYFLLMPEAWPDNKDYMERPKPRIASPKVEYDDEFYARIKEIVPADEFQSGADKSVKTGASDLRTINPTLDSPLTSADVKAFARTLDNLDDFKGIETMVRIYGAGTFLDLWEQENGKAIPVNALKDVVNPCQRLIQKLRIAGLEREFRIAIGGEGFNPKTWAYTCDKTIKAYRMGQLSSGMLSSVKAYKRGVYDAYIDSLGDRKAEMQFSAMQSVIEMYQAPLNDILEVRKNRKLLREKFSKIKYRILGEPISVLN